MTQKLTRREFLKLFGLATISYTTSSDLLSVTELQKKRNGSTAPNVLILVFDTLSARHMSTFGYPRQSTPNISKFAERAFVYHNHYSAGNFTTPGTASLLTGVYPWSHRALHTYGTVTEQYKEKNLFSLFTDSHFISTYTHNSVVQILLNQFKGHIDQYELITTLCLLGELYSEKLFSADFPVALWSETILRRSGVSIPGSLFLSKLEFEKFWKDFLTIAPNFRDQYPEGLPYTTRGLFFKLEQAIDWIQDQMVTLPQSFLAYYHLFPPHGHYRPRSDFLNIFDDGLEAIPKPEHEFTLNITKEQIYKDRQKYDEYIAFVDSEFGRLVKFMEMEGVLDNTIVILTSDHGELFERGIIGHFTPVLYQDILRVPLLISLPKQHYRYDIHTPTSSVDLLPTILSILGHQIPDYLEGQILPGINQSSHQDNRSIYVVEAKSNSKYKPLKLGTIALIKGKLKLIHYLGYEEDIQDELYDLENDPEELENLFDEKNIISMEMLNELSEKIDEVNLEFGS